jgi:hypothetical protein
MRFLLPSLLFFSFIRFGTVAFGEPATPVPPQARQTPQKTSVPVVVSVDDKSITIQNGIHVGMKVTHHDEEIKADAKQSAVNVRKYTVSRFTEISINGQRCALSDIKPGMQVRVTAGTDPSAAAIVAAKVEGMPQIAKPQ